MSVIRSLIGDKAADAVKRSTGVEWMQKRREFRRSLEREEQDNQRRVEFLGRHIPRGGIGAELGVFQGRFSPHLLRVLEPQLLHLVDPWYLLTAEWHWGHGSRSTVDAVINILEMHRRLIAERRVLVHIADDRQLLESMPDEYFDWVYVDSSHQYAHTCEELEILRRKVKSAGLIAGDDWQPDPQHRHHGVFRAVQELIDGGDYELVEADIELHQWIVKSVDTIS